MVLAEKPKPQQQNTSPAPHAENEITPEDELKLQGIARMNYVREWVLAFSLYAEQNQGRFPTNFDQADPFLREEAKAEAKPEAEPKPAAAKGKRPEKK